MIGKSLTAGVASLVCLCASISGCQVAGDLVNPDLLATIGVDPQTVHPITGRIVVAMNNTSAFDASFFVAVANKDLTDPQTASADVGNGETGNAVFDCPVGLVAPGGFDAMGNTLGTTVLVTTPTAVVPVAYTGVPLESGRDFQCGD